MFKNTSIKNVVINSMVVLSIMLLIVGFLVGKNIEEKEEKAKQSQNRNETYTEKYSYSGSDSNSNNSSDFSNKKNSHEHYEFDNPEVDKVDVPSQQPKTLEDFFSKEDLEKSKKVAEIFIKNYYQFNGDNPLEHIKKSEKYMSKELLNKLKTNMIRPTQTIYKKELTYIEVYEPYNVSNEYITWNVRVKGKVFNIQGEFSKEEIYDYSLKMIKENNEYKVDKFALNIAH